jgi:hypothetical protein
VTTDQHELQHVAEDQHTDGHGTDVAHRHERPEDWGWHADLHKPTRIAGLVSAVLLILFVHTTYNSGWELVWSVGIGVFLLLWLAFDQVRRLRTGRRR